MQSCGNCTKRMGLERELGGEKVLCCVEQVLMLQVCDLFEVQPFCILLPDCCSRAWVGEMTANPTVPLLRYFGVLGLWLLMFEELLPSLLETDNVIAELREGLSDLVHAKREDITHCYYEAETFFGKECRDCDLLHSPES